MDGISETVEPPDEMLRRVRQQMGRAFDSYERYLLVGYISTTHGTDPLAAGRLVDAAKEEFHGK